ncbi:MAG TPA: hypothetical protein VM779_04035 [Thermoanaerobaculia bacterium]|nr:hypothetical protein [Thermoanaerobaculia bacterium]
MIDLTTAPPSLSRREMLLAGMATVVVAVTRVLALARTPWDWDEMLFLLGLRDYDVALHHPHPPGFPLFLLAARLFMELGLEPFRALQAVNLVAAVAIVPAVLFFCRELRLPFPVSLAAALLFSFFPNVWFFGGTGFSDVAAIVLTLFACALLLRGGRSPAAFLSGAVVIAVAAGFRPQNLLVGALPALAGAWSQLRQRRFGTVAGAAGIVLVITAGSYAGAVMATGEWSRYRDSLLAHQRYLVEVDSFLSEIRPSLLQVSDDFFVRPFRFPAANAALSLLATLSAVTALVRRRMAIVLAIATFGPFWLLAWFTLDFHSASRFSIGYMPLLAILAADGIATVAAWSRRSPRVQGVATIALAGLLAAGMAVWTWNGIRRVREEPSPPLQAIAFVRQTFAAETIVYVPKRLRPHAEYYLDDFRLVHIEDEPTAAALRSSGAVYLLEGDGGVAGGRTFAWPEEPLWNIARRRYFKVSVIPIG